MILKFAKGKNNKLFFFLQPLRILCKTFFVLTQPLCDCGSFVHLRT